MGGDITKICGCNNKSGLTSNETNMLEQQKNPGVIQIKNGSLPSYQNDSEKPQKYNSMTPIEFKTYIAQVNKIIRAYRKYKKRLTRQLEPEYHSNISSGFNQSSIFDFRGNKDQNGHKEGFGIQKWKDGSKYTGYFSKNKACGWGIIYHPDGDIYRGEFSNDKANGYGEYVHENGAVYYGSWCDDSQFDVGYEIWSDSSCYSGTYVNGMKDGIGTYLWQDNTKYQGEWKENCIEGFGIYNFADGRVYIGQWQNNQMHGYGEFSWKEGKKYYGFYRYDKKNGFGMYYWPKEKYYIGFWKDGKQHGVGKYFKGNIVKYGIWKDGKKEKWFSDERDFLNCLDPRDEKYTKMFQMDYNDVEKFMETGEID